MFQKSNYLVILNYNNNALEEKVNTIRKLEEPTQYSFVQSDLSVPNHPSFQYISNLVLLYIYIVQFMAKFISEWIFSSIMQRS